MRTWPGHQVHSSRWQAADHAQLQRQSGKRPPQPDDLLLLSKCAEHTLCIINTIFCQVDKYKTTWMHPRSKQWQLIGYIIARQKDLRNVCITRAMRGADHRVARAVLQLHIAPTQRKWARAAINTARLRHCYLCHRFQETLYENLRAAQDHCDGDSKNHPRPPKARVQPAQVPMWIVPRAQHNRHDFHSEAN